MAPISTPLALREPLLPSDPSLPAPQSCGLGLCPSASSVSTQITGAGPCRTKVALKPEGKEWCRDMQGETSNSYLLPYTRNNCTGVKGLSEKLKLWKKILASVPNLGMGRASQSKAGARSPPCFQHIVFHAPYSVSAQ